MSQILCVGNLPKFMHQKLDGELKKFFHSCGVLKVHLLTGQKFCFIEYSSANGVNDAKKLIANQAFLGKVLKIDTKNPSEFIDPSQFNIKPSKPTGQAMPYGDQQAQQAQQAPTPQKPKEKHDEGVYCLEVLNLPLNTRQTQLMEVAYTFGVKECRVAPPLAKLWVMKDMRENVYKNMDKMVLGGNEITVRYPTYKGQRPSQFDAKEACRIIVEGIADPDEPKVTELLTARFAAYGRVNGVEILRNRKPCCAFIDIERNMANIAVSEVDQELFFRYPLTVALMKQDDVIVIDSEEEEEKRQEDMKNEPPRPPGQTPKFASSIPPASLLPDKIVPPAANDTNAIIELMNERERLEVLHPYEEYLLRISPVEGSIGLDDAEPLPNPPQQFIRLMMDRAIVRVKLMKLAENL